MTLRHLSFVFISLDTTTLDIAITHFFSHTHNWTLPHVHTTISF